MKPVKTSALILLVTLAGLPSGTQANQHSTSATQRMVLGASAFTAMTLEGLIRANSFSFYPRGTNHFDDWYGAERPGDSSFRGYLKEQRFGSLALRHADQVVIEAQLPDTRALRGYNHFLLNEESFQAFNAARAATDPAERARLFKKYDGLRERLKQFYTLSDSEVERIYGQGPRRVSFTIPKGELPRIEGIFNRINLDSGAKVTRVRILTGLFSQRIATAMRFARNGAVALSAVAAAGLLIAEESYSVAESVRRNGELARLMQEK